ncbi:Uma2 family endonuclease [Actinocrispum wychmicini]|uniref:Uma2 family endonuclease n=1 Tax=Actinocrispum wychmicini TaxID=1213861 RepID=A0A4R2JE49_9PSEU|nr:Uma2 family endonuclease [Actinocrispum wychmicini]TCO57254.1 Uma2 family endonuclease [Actinocrispum wychmicini]
MSSAVYGRDHLLSLAEWDALPEDTHERHELVDGMLQVSPSPVWDHQKAAKRLVLQLDPQLPGDLCLTQDYEVILFGSGRPTVRRPDLLIAPDAAGEDNPARITAKDVLLAIEIMSPGSQVIDRMHKFTEYARAGIENYWIVDPERPVTISVFELVGEVYKLVVETADTLSVAAPVALTVDVQALLP